MNEIKDKIYVTLEKMKERVEADIAALTDAADVRKYREFVRYRDGMEIWSDAFQKAIDAHEIIYIPASGEVYYIDTPLVLPSDRHIEADADAIIRQTPDSELILLRNRHAKDGTHAPIDSVEKDRNISINGGRWEESHTARAGYGKSNKYDENRSYYGVTTCMFFSNMEGLSLTNMVFCHTAGFSVQTGDIKNTVMENIYFDDCFADGLHINGNCENVVVRNIAGRCGDDLVAFNMYDWLNSSVNFGPLQTVLCENIDVTQTPYKTLRIQPGIYWYDDGTAVDCAIYDAIFKNIKGINTFKLYFQTPFYQIGTEPERGAIGTADRLFFEDVSINFEHPLDELGPYMESDPIRGTAAGFEMGSRVGHLYMENVRMTADKAKWPMAFFACIGPKSVTWGDPRVEVFDPYISSSVEYLEMKDVYFNGEKVTSAEGVLKEIVFDDINGDGHSSGRGEFHNVVIL